MKTLPTPASPVPRRALLLAALQATLAPLAAQAEPGGTVRCILPNATGSGVDAIARAAQTALAKALGSAVVVDNQPGAGGVLGLQALARSPADGNTLALVSNNVVIFPSLLKSLPFDMPGDFSPIALLGATPMVLVLNPERMPVTQARDWVELLKTRPADFHFGSGGNGTILHLASELVLDEVGATAQHIPYRGVGPMVTDLIGGQIDFACVALPSVQAHLKSGALRAVGLLTARRSAAAPDIPTWAEQGWPQLVLEAWFAAIGPRGLSDAALARLHAALSQAFADPQVKDAMARQGNTIHISTPEQALQAFRSERLKYAALVKKVGLQAQ